MTHSEKIQWLEQWAERNKAEIDLEGGCGFGRECVGVVSRPIQGEPGLFPDYEWTDSDYNRIDNNGYVWTPENAYHKHPCLAVLGRREVAESQLYDWVRWFDDNGFVLETGELDAKHAEDGILFIMIGVNYYARMVKKN